MQSRLFIATERDGRFSDVTDHPTKNQRPSYSFPEDANECNRGYSLQQKEMVDSVTSSLTCRLRGTQLDQRLNYVSSNSQCPGRLPDR